MQLHVGHIANYSKLHVYRRHNNSKPNHGGYYYGMGRWERVLVTTAPTSGNITLNLRGPTHYDTFPYIPAGLTLGVGPAVVGGPVKPVPISPQSISANVTLANGTTQIVSAEEEGQEFLFIVEKTGNVFSGVGSFIRTQRATGGVDTNQLSPARYQVLPYGYTTPSGSTGILNYGVFQSISFRGEAIGRNLNEARLTTLTANTVGFSSSIPYSSNGGLGGITKFITYPTTDFGANISPAIV